MRHVCLHKFIIRPQIKTPWAWGMMINEMTSNSILLTGLALISFPIGIASLRHHYCDFVNFIVIIIIFYIVIIFTSLVLYNGCLADRV